MSARTLSRSVGTVLLVLTAGLLTAGAAAQQQGPTVEGMHLTPAFLAGAAAVLGGLALVLRVLPGVFRPSSETGMAVRTLTLIEQQQAQWKDARAEEHEQLEELAHIMQRVTASLERAASSMTAVALNVEQTHRDLAAHNEAAAKSRAQIAEMYGKLTKGRRG